MYLLNNLDLGGNRLDNAVYTGQPFVPGGRLTLTSATPVTTSDITAASTVYYTPYLHDRIALYDGTRVRQYTFTETSVSLSGLTSGKNYDIYAFISGGVVNIAVYGTPWTSDTARSAFGLFNNGGYLCVANNASQRYLGTIRTTSTTTTEDSTTKRYLWNYYNRTDRPMASEDGTSHTYSTNSWRLWNNGSNTPKIEWVQGLVEDPTNLGVIGEQEASTGVYAYTGAGLNGSNPAGRHIVGVRGVLIRAGYVEPVWARLGYNSASAYELATGATGTFARAAVSGSVLG